MEDVYGKNLSALKKINPKLAQKIENIKSNERFDVFQGNQFEAINILDTKTDEFLYIKPIDDMIKQQIYLRAYREYEYLFMYGVGNGIIIQKLLENQKLSKLIIVEKEIELIYIVLNLLDLSQEILTTRLVIFSYDSISLPILVELLNSDKLKYYAKVYTLLTQTPYYEKIYNKEIQNTNSLFIDAYKQRIYTDGNDITDQLTGLKHTVANLPLMLKNATLAKLKKKKNCDIAVVVSTGPSLYKQLPLLQKYQDYIAIISVDASLPILEKHDIKPDIVTSIERVKLTAEFFKKTSAKFQKDIICVSALLQHKVVLDAIKGKKVLIQKPFAYNSYFGFDDYGYIWYGMSAANLAHEVALVMGYSKCLLIGHDLAYAKDGSSHAKGHVLGEKDVEHKDTDIMLRAYGGNGEVKSTIVWQLFKNFFELVIHKSSSHIPTYNCTEGGARIDGAIEATFEEMLKNITNKKEKIKIRKPTKEIYSSNMKTAREKIKKIVEEGEFLQQEINKAFISLEKFAKKYENIDFKKALKKAKDKIIIKKLNTIEKIRNTIEHNELFSEFYADIAKPYLLHYELDLTVIKAKAVDTTDENRETALRWILSHRYWLFSLSGIINNIVEISKKELEKWDD
ncbi:MAG: DUF115 domain-containing protein [Campylobacteraceae bacterium]|nr:DUF115 domain-containing protein [Campylobacteraceae bacterium]